MRLTELFEDDQAARMKRAAELGFTVDAYHGTSRDFDAFRHQKHAHLGFHFGSTPAAAQDKLKADRQGETSINRGAEAMSLFEPDERDAAVAKLRQQHTEISKALSALRTAIYDRQPKRSQADDDALAAALQRDDEAEVTRLLNVAQPMPTADEAARIKDLEARLADTERQMTIHYSQVRPGERVIPVKLRLQNPVRMRDTNWGDAARIAADNRELRLPSNSILAIRQELQRRGYDGIVYRNEVEDVGADSYLVFSPNQIRSRFARFDPKKAKSGNIMEAVFGHDPRQQELYPINADVRAERIADLLAATPHFASYLQGRYSKDIKVQNILSHVAGFFNAMWENRKGASNPELLSSLAEVWPYTGPCYRIIGVSLSNIPSYQIDRYPALKRMLIGRFDPKDEAALSEFYDYLMHISFQDYESWSKSLDGINYFDQLRHAHTRNVIYKAMMHRGLDFQAMAETLHDIGILKNSDRLAKTIGAQEVIGAVANPVPVRWKMVKWFREDHPADMVIDGKKYRWTDKGTLARVGPARR